MHDVDNLYIVIRCEIGENNQLQSELIWDYFPQFEDPIIQIKFEIHLDLIKKVSRVIDQELKRLFKLHGPPLH